MSNPPIEPIIEVSGSAFMGNTIQATRPINQILDRNRTNYVSLTDFCRENYITKRLGYILIKRKLLIGQRIYGQWWVCSHPDPDCKQALLDYLGIEALLFDAENL